MNNLDDNERGDFSMRALWARVGWFVLAWVVVGLLVWGFAYLFGQLWERLQWGH